MADHFLGNLPIVRGDLDLVRVGAWTADIYLSTTEAPTVGTTTTLTVGGTQRIGTVIASSADYLQVKCRVVAGAGKLGVVTEARDYQGFTASTIAQDTLQDAEETPGSWGALDVYCPHWTRRQVPCIENLRRLCRLLTAEDVLSDGIVTTSAPRWRVLDDGTVDTVVDDFAVVATPPLFQQLASWGQERLLLLAVQDSTIVPGKSVVAWNVQRCIDRVRYSFANEAFQAWCWYL